MAGYSGQHRCRMWITTEQSNDVYLYSFFAKYIFITVEKQKLCL